MVFFIFIQILIEHSVSKQWRSSKETALLSGQIKKKPSGDPDQMPHAVASGLGLHCLPMSHKRTLDLNGLSKAF